MEAGALVSGFLVQSVFLGLQSFVGLYYNVRRNCSKEVCHRPLFGLTPEIPVW